MQSASWLMAFSVLCTGKLTYNVVGVEVGTRSMHSYNAEDLSGIEQE